MTLNPMPAFAALGVLATAAVAVALPPVDLGFADDDVWAYYHAADPGSDSVLRVYGNDGLDLNPLGYPGPPPSSFFYSHAFVSWDLDGLPPDFQWNGATVELTVVDGSNYDPATDDVYIRALTAPFDESTYVFGVGPAPITAGRLAGDDSTYNGIGSVIRFEIPARVDQRLLRQWARDGKIYFMISSDIDFDNDGKLLRFASSENLLFDGPKLVLN